ncbi:MAG: DUF1990 domain-containing protein [Acidobacteriota bacterium]|nr:DUF1990 domain-containing protein [Acidobacteriota bacterium]
MFCLTKPTAAEIRNFLKHCRADDFSYAEIGSSRFGERFETAAEYSFDHNRIKIGNGAEDYGKAVEAVKSWKMFDLSWVELHRTDTPIIVGENVAVLASHFGFWSLNASRIVYLIEENDGAVEKFGFAYGTLTEHGESGEERFTVEFHKENGEVWYDLYAFSKPQHILAQIGFPIARMLQSEFAEDSKKAMVRAGRNKSIPTDCSP